MEKVRWYGSHAIVNRMLAISDARELYNAKKAQIIDSEESPYLRVLSSQHIYQLRETFAEYSKASLHSSLKRSVMCYE